MARITATSWNILTRVGKYKEAGTASTSDAVEIAVLMWQRGCWGKMPKYICLSAYDCRCYPRGGLFV